MNKVPITEQDKLNFNSVIENTLQKPEQAEAMAKVLYNLALRLNAVPQNFMSEFTRLMEGDLVEEGKTILPKALNEISTAVLSLAEEDISRSYTTGQLSKIFGVSISTINNWIDANRFVGFSRPAKNKQARISESTIWVSPTGERIPVSEVAKLYQTNLQKMQLQQEPTKYERVRYLVEMIKFYEERYEGLFEEVVKEKGDPSMTENFQWSREGKEWRAFLQEIESD
ncbi:hypothetical protein [Paenibacillus medicaginis]|uniref:DNA-binding protein n=1 Tax=Paenibacillus medicaginis TaxID=1470560 RepID=A0ABV5C2V8_9BACL